MSSPRLLPLLLACLLAGGCASLVQSVKNQECVLDPDQPFDVVEIDPARDVVRLYWQQADGQPFGTLDAVRQLVEREGAQLVAATNAGIFEPGFVPTGLYIEDGAVMHPLNLDDGEGNFFLKPNGVFFVTDLGLGIVEASQFSTLSVEAQYATQSGPLLVQDGQIHPAFNVGSTNCRLRSGIGVAPDGRAYLAISNGTVNFYDFAVFFRDRLGTSDALYLDGGISKLYAPGLNRREDGDGFAAILAVIARE